MNQNEEQKPPQPIQSDSTTAAQESNNDKSWEEILANHIPTAKTYDEALDLAFQMYPEDLVLEELLREYFSQGSRTNPPYRSPLFKVVGSGES